MEKQSLSEIQTALAQLQMNAEKREAVERRLSARLDEDAQRNQQVRTFGNRIAIGLGLAID